MHAVKIASSRDFPSQPFQFHVHDVTLAQLKPPRKTRGT